MNIFYTDLFYFKYSFSLSIHYHLYFYSYSQDEVTVSSSDLNAFSNLAVSLGVRGKTYDINLFKLTYRPS